MKYTKNKWKVIKKFKNVKDVVYGVNCYGDVKNLDTGEILKKKFLILEKINTQRLGKARNLS